MEEERSRARTLKKILSFPPYNYIVELLNKLKNKDYDREKYSQQDEHLLKILIDTFSRDLDKDINEKLRLIEIEEDLIKLVESTDNNIFYRKLFFPSIFINNQFKFENWIIKGILVEEVCSFTAEGVWASRKDLDNFNDYIIFMSAIDPNTTNFWNKSFSLINKDTISVISVDITKDKDQNKRVEEYIRAIICNLVDMVEGNDEDLSIVTIESNRDQNLKRIKKGKVGIPTKVYIRAKGEFKKYVQKFNADFLDNAKGSEKGKLGYKFLVRGHWRHFKADKFIHKKGKRRWIKPFYKGEGIVISKEYKLVKGYAIEK